MRAYCLSFHAAYRCAHSGACCTAGWPIPTEEDPRPHLQAHGVVLPERGRLVRAGRTRVGGRSLFLATAPDGACVFFEPDAGRLCTIHRVAGEQRLPASCRNFPRIALRDARGVSVTLSHFCPTAARLLLTAGEIAIVPAPDSISLGGGVDGLDARRVLPPLLREGMLMDFPGYAAWEREAIAVLNHGSFSARDALQVIRTATEEAGGWRAAGEPLARRVARAFRRARAGQPPGPRPFGPLESAAKAFLAAHLFASWAAYQRGGLSAVPDAVEEALDLLGSGTTDADAFVAAVRSADLRLRHSAD